MSNNIYSLISGFIFGIGLIIAGMANPAKVLAFLDIAGNWDPSLAVVMGMGLITLYGLQHLPNNFPMFSRRIDRPDCENQKPEINVRLIVGATIFGIGWGLAGICPGPAMVNLTIAGPDMLLFVLSMFAGFALFHRFHDKQN